MSITSTEFNDKVAFVTGASSGIGRAAALAFGQKGARVACVDVAEDGGLQTRNLILEQGGKAEFFKCDVSKSADVAKVVEETVQKLGRLDFAFNNAGIEGESGQTADCTEANWTRVIDINLKGVWLCMKFQLPHMLRQKSGAIVNCASIAGLVGFVGSPAYVASKHGIVGLTKTAALEYAKFGVRVNAVCPGVIQTPMIDRFTHGDTKSQYLLTASEPVGRLGTPGEVAEAVLWLCSPGASFVTGHSMPVDGGWVAQ